jgi:hypothetical protein
MEKHNWIFEETHKEQQGSEIVASILVIPDQMVDKRPSL